MTTPQPRTPQRAHTLRLLLGDQLNPEHSWFATQDDGVVYVLMEVRQETDYVLHHAQKILAIFAAMTVGSSMALACPCGMCNVAPGWCAIAWHRPSPALENAIPAIQEASSMLSRAARS